MPTPVEGFSEAGKTTQEIGNKAEDFALGRARRKSTEITRPAKQSLTRVSIRHLMQLCTSWQAMKA